MTKQEPKENEMTDINPTTPDDLPLDPDLATGNKGDETTFGSFGYQDTESSGTDSSITLINANNTSERMTVPNTGASEGNTIAPGWQNCTQVQITFSNSTEGSESFTVPPVSNDSAITSLMFQHSGDKAGNYNVNNTGWQAISGS